MESPQISVSVVRTAYRRTIRAVIAEPFSQRSVAFDHVACIDPIPCHGYAAEDPGYDGRFVDFECDGQFSLAGGQRVLKVNLGQQATADLFCAFLTKARRPGGTRSHRVEDVGFDKALLPRRKPHGFRSRRTWLV